MEAALEVVGLSWSWTFADCYGGCTEDCSSGWNWIVVSAVVGNCAVGGEQCQGLQWRLFGGGHQLLLLHSERSVRGE